MVAALSEAELTERVEALRIPLLQPGTPLDWKDWYHFVLMDLASGWRAIVNVSLAASGDDAELQLTIVVHEGGGDPAAAPPTHGCSLSVPWRAGMVQARPLRIQAPGLSLAFEQQVFVLAARPHGSTIEVELQARPDATPLLVTEASPFGSGFIGWGVMPRLRAQGRLRVGEREVAIDPGWFCYQDHNFGRFRWGEDFGWEWLVAHCQSSDGPQAEPITVVVDVRCDQLHRRGGLPYLFVLSGRAVRKVFLGPAMRMRWHWSEQASLPPRLPGAMATLLADRTGRHPVAIEVTAADELDRLQLRIAVDAYVEIVAPDNRGAGH
ncbi:MAG TPA: hypothetical protein VLA16_27610, partial [Ideonella sp.]|nr:hypothetical protein [Ideonella sp.]